MSVLHNTTVPRDKRVRLPYFGKNHKKVVSTRKTPTS